MSSLSDRLAAARRATESAAAGAVGKHSSEGEEPTPAGDDPAQPTERASLDPAGAAAAVAAAARRGPAKPAEPTPSQRRSRAAAQTDRIEELKSSVHVELLKQLGPQLYDADMDQAELDRRVRAVLADVMGSQDRPLSSSDRARVTQEISDDILGYGPIEPYLRDPDVSEVMVNGADSIYLERSGRLVPADATFADEAHLRRTIDKIVSRIGRRVDESSPMVDARLPDGSRVNA
ncbi:MAG: ATPase, T2SS/T4P/T4SS family, partial [Nocardioides sp.]|nr:ATPase, T2SS/T4P/T4SS family [Nocardioides sp.]